MTGDTLFDVAIDGRDLDRVEAALVEAAKICAIGLPRMHMTGMLWEEAQERSIPRNGSILGVESADRNVQAIERRTDRAKNFSCIDHDPLSSRRAAPRSPFIVEPFEYFTPGKTFKAWRKCRTRLPIRVFAL
jgi:hypothetical protein